MQLYKQMKTMEVNAVWPAIYDEGYIHQFQHGSTPVIQYQQQKDQV